MISVFNSGIEHYFIYLALFVMLAITIEFWLMGAYKHDTILLCSNIITTICIALYIFGNGEVAVIFVVSSYLFLNVYSSVFRRRNV